VDAVSWRIVLEDLQTAYEQIEQGLEVELGAKTTSYKQWAEKLRDYSQSEEIREESKYWDEIDNLEVEAIPVDSHQGENVVSSVERVVERLSREETEQMLKEVPEVYHTQINEVLMSAMLLAMRGWSGSHRVKVEMEGHGREEVVEGVDITRTVGWFTSVYPVVVESSSDKVEEVVKEVKEQVRRIPRRGIGYGVMRYLSGEERRGERREAEISYNYLGQIDQMTEEGRFEMGREIGGEPEDGAERRRELIGVNAAVMRGELNVEWSYSSNRHRRESIEGLARGYQRELRRIIEHCVSRDAAAYTSTDFAEFGWSEEDLDDIIMGINSSSSAVEEH